MIKHKTSKSQDNNNSEEGAKLSQAVKQMRADLGLTQDEFGEIFDVKGRTVSRWENGEAPDFFKKLSALRDNLKKIGKNLEDYLI